MRFMAVGLGGRGSGYLWYMVFFSLCGGCWCVMGLTFAPRRAGGIAGCDMCAVFAGVRAALELTGTDACIDVCGGDVEWLEFLGFSESGFGFLSAACGCVSFVWAVPLSLSLVFWVGRVLFGSWVYVGSRVVRNGLFSFLAWGPTPCMPSPL
jgi:hypothetical protein